MTYLDNAATTPIKSEVLDAMLPYLKEQFYNPSAVYSAGSSVKKAIDDARELIAGTLHASQDEIFFTSGGTEADNMAIKGLFYGRDGNHMIVSSIEHPAVLNTVKFLEKESMADVTYLPVDRFGIVNITKLKNIFKKDTNFVSIMAVNNEIGSIQPMEKIGTICYTHGIPFHTDAVQAYGHIPIDVEKYNIGLMSASAHKIGGPKGIGFLYIKKIWQKDLLPIILGGKQERGFRAGTENVPGIIGMAKAAELSFKNLVDDFATLTNLRAVFIEKIRRRFPKAELNSSEVSISFPAYINLNLYKYGIKGEELQAFLSEFDIYTSTGSACSSANNEPSHVLLAVGKTPEEANASLRITFSANNTVEDIDKVLEGIDGAVKAIGGKNEVSE